MNKELVDELKYLNNKGRIGKDNPKNRNYSAMRCSCVVEYDIGNSITISSNSIHRFILLECDKKLYRKQLSAIYITKGALYTIYGLCVIKMHKHNRTAISHNLLDVGRKIINEDDLFTIMITQ